MSRTDIDDVARRAELLSPDEQLLLLERLARQVRSRIQPANRQSLRGIWKGKVSEDEDIDALLHEIRTAWKADVLE